MRWSSNISWYAGVGVALFMLTACAANDCMPPRGQASLIRGTTAATAVEEEDRTGSEKKDGPVAHGTIL